MSAVLLPGSAVPAQRVRPRKVRRKASGLAACVLLLVVLLQLAAAFMPQLLQWHPLQQSITFKQVSGYAMLVLMGFAMSFGWLRRLPALARRHATLNEAHQVAGLLILALLASHLGHTPAGFLLLVFNAMAIAVAAGALRAMIGPRIGPRGCMVLLAAHIGLCCLVLAAALVHLYLVYAYTA